MKKILLGTALLIISMTGASAADLPTRKPAPAPVVYAPLFTWTGFYVGLNAGYAWGNGNTTLASNTGSILTGTGLLGGYGTKANGFIGGGQIGYNYQINQFVLGAEADIQFADAKKSASWAGTSGGVNYTLGANGELNYLGTVRARAGFAFDRALFYLTGGLAYGEVGGSATATSSALGAWYGSSSTTKVGWTVGAGVEYAITNNITTKLEYLYYDLGNSRYATNSLAGNVINGKFESSGNIVRAGLNYKF